MKKIGLFVAGVLFGTAGIKLLSSRDARKAYAHTTAAALRAKEDVMKTGSPPCGRARMTSTQKPRPSTSAAQRRRPPLWWRTLPRRTLRRSDP